MNKYLSREAYHQTKWFIRRYPELKARYALGIAEQKKQDGQPRGNAISDPTFNDVEKLLKLSDEIWCIEEAMKHIPPEYIKDVMANIISHTPFPDYAERKTWRKWESRFIRWVAFYAGIE